MSATPPTPMSTMDSAMITVLFWSCVSSTAWAVGRRVLSDRADEGSSNGDFASRAAATASAIPPTPLLLLEILRGRFGSGEANIVHPSGRWSRDCFRTVLPTSKGSCCCGGGGGCGGGGCDCGGGG